MAATLTLDDVRKAWDARDPRLIKLLEQLVNQPVPRPTAPVRNEAPTFDKFLVTLRSYQYRSKTRDEQAHYRTETLKALEAADAEVPLGDKLKVHEVIYSLWQSNDALARDYLLRIIATVPVAYGPWKALKRIFKEAEAKHDTEVYGALAARIDAASAGGSGGHGKVSGATLAYCARRAWRYLRRVAVQLPATYPDAACDYLINYADNTNWRNTWVFNHVLFHGTKKYGRNRFQFGYRDVPEPTNLKFRAYGDLWKRSHRPLFSLLDRAKSDAVRSFAIAALKTDFREKLRETEPAWVIRLVGVPSAAIHEFVVWILQNVPKFEQGAFRTLGLHEYVLKLFDSPSQAAREYAANYARTHARDLSIDELIRLANNDNDKVRKLAFDLLGEKDPRTGVGLDAWGRLLETEHGTKFAADAITKNFGPKELTPEWFQGRLLSKSGTAFEFASKLLPRTHNVKDLGPAFYLALLRKFRQGESNDEVVDYAAHDLARHYALDAIDPEQLRWLALFPHTANHVLGWVQQGKLKAQSLGLDFWKAVAFQPDWDASEWLAAFKRANGQWARELEFDEGRAGTVLNWFRDVRKFTPQELGFDWLMRLVARSEPVYHDFASDRLIKTFVPADFAPRESGVGSRESAKPAAVNLAAATVSFTGKLAAMSTAEFDAAVKAAGGKAAANVSPKLHYLVVGDQGSPFLGQGEKGAKHLKAEELNAAGANIRIISESMFLRLISGQSVGAAPADAVSAGCERLWQFVVAPGPADAPVARFAREYVRHHHAEIGAKLSGKPVDPGADIPAAFLSLDRVFPLFSETRKPLRDFALELAGYEFARWNPGVDHLVAMSEIPFMDVRRFVAKSLLADDTPPNRPFRLDATKLEASAVYRFCESNDEETRALGMELIKRQARLRVPEELFRLSESPDRKVRAFVIRALWTVYRDRGVTADWKPPPPPKPTVGAKAKKDAEKAAVARGEGVPHKPEQWPAPRPSLSEFLRRILFEIPPGRPEKSRDAVDDGAEPGGDPGAAKPDKVVSVKPLPARRAKLDLVEVMRDLALEEKAFGGGILPLLDEFMTSRGPSERAACLVAVTRIRHKYPELKKA
ncbi:BRCT domain-containing protein [Gemmata sp.]|uniref:BRCT domain-containing protein n=1 Tax=Gemmata sp. TaxID=1914242 RepID=UPI003F6E7C41